MKSDLERKSEKQFGAKECEAIWSERVRSDLEQKSEEQESEFPTLHKCQLIY